MDQAQRDSIIKAALLTARARGDNPVPKEGGGMWAEADIGGMWPEHRLEWFKYYYLVAAELKEDKWRIILSGLAPRKLQAASTLVGEWVLKGKAALNHINGEASAHDMSMLEQEAAVISGLTGRTYSVDDLAFDISMKFEPWVTAGVLMTGVRRAASLLIEAQTTEEGCAEVYAALSLKSDQALEMFQARKPLPEIIQALYA